MGWTVLYIAFGVVALWLLGEVLLQYKARLRWRLVAFAGFLGVVLGVLTRSVVIIGLGAAAFTVGQTFVTLSFRRGFVAGWAVKRPDEEPEPESAGGSKRRRGRGSRLNDPVLDAAGYEPEEREYDEGTPAYGGDGAPAYGQDAYAQDAYGQAPYGQDDDQDRDDVFTPARPADPTAAETTNVYEPQPLPEDTGSYGVYGADGTNGAGTDYAAAANADYGNANGDPAYATAAQTQDQGYGAAQGTDQNYAYDYSGYGQQSYGYDASGQQQYAGYTDQQYATGQNYTTAYDAYGNPQQYAQQGYGQGQYTGGYGETPADGVWVPQQRTDENYGGEVPPEQQQYGYQQNNGQQNSVQPGNGYDEQYRF